MSDNVVVKPEEFIVDTNSGRVKTDGNPKDPKQKWYVKIFVHRNQQIGLGVLFILTIVTVWYFRTYGVSGLIAVTVPYQKYTTTQPVQLWLYHEEWSSTTYKDAEQEWSYETDPADAIVEVRNGKTGEMLILNGDVGIPSNWVERQWRIANEEPRTSVRVTLTPH